MPVIPQTAPIPDQPMRPTCPNCSTTMVLTQIDRDKMGEEIGNFCCPRCGYAETKRLKIP
jgi:DNA-directed RNA polymerase subunit M/transcription elongation factor TFIIS